MRKYLGTLQATYLGAYTPGEYIASPSGPQWTSDATSGIAVPATTDEWSKFIAANGLAVAVPDAVWSMQQPSGDVADATGNGFDLTAAGTGLAYQQAVAGWSRKAITFTDGGTGQLKSSAATLPDILTTSQLTLMYATVSAPGAARQLISHGTTLDQIDVAITSVPRVRSASNTLDGSSNSVGVVRPWVLRTNRTASTCTGLTDLENIAPTFSTTVTGKGICFGANPSNAPTMSVLYAVQWHGANAEMPDATLRSLLQAMGSTITW